MKRHFTYLLITCCVFGFGESLIAQTVKGQVFATDINESLIGVTIQSSSSEGGVATDYEGNFEIPAEQGDVLTFKYTGYETVERTVDGDSFMAIEMSPSAEMLDEVVVVGYGTVRKSDLTGSVGSVKAEALAQTTITTLEQGLQGRLAGVQVTQGDAAPGAGMSIQIRGTNSILGGSEPLYVVDGIPITNPGASQGDLGASEPNNRIVSNTNVLATLSPSDIESIEVLKDASATAIYGSRGANGVVMITTKKGKDGKGQVSLNYSYGLSQIANKLDMLNVEQFMDYQNRAYENAGLPAESYPWAPDSLGTGGKATISEVLALGSEVEQDWQDEIYQVAPVQDIQLGFSGGNAKGNYSVMLNYLDQEGIIKGSMFTRGGFRTNLSYEVNDRITVGSSIAVTRARNSLIKTSSTTTQAAGGIVRSALTYQPILPLERNDDGVIELRNLDGDDVRLEDPSLFQQFGANPLRYTDEVTEQQNFTRIIGGVNTSIELFEGLTADIRIASNFLDRKNNTYYPRTVSEGFGLNGLAVVASNEFSNLVNENLLRYNLERGIHRFEALGGFTYETNRDYWITNEARDFPDDNLSFYALQTGLSHVPTRTNSSQWQLASWLGRGNYVLSDKYLLTATLRYDGSSKFAANNKWAPFYSVAFAWRASEEPFIKNIEALTNLKVRASYGQSGNQAVGPYQSLATIEGVTTSFNNQLVSAVVEGRLQNNNLRWETTTQSNLGIDAEIFSGRLFVTANVYNKRTEDLLQNITLAPNTGFTNALINAGTIQNKGFELELGGYPVRGEFSWEVSGNFSRNINEIVDLGGVKEQFADRLGAGNGLTVFPFIQRPGLPIGVIYGFEEDGIFQNAEEVAEFKSTQPDAALGQIKYKDLNGDGAINENDRAIIGDVNPNFIWGLSNTLTYKGFDFSFLFQGVQGADIINTLRISFDNLNGRGNIPVYAYEDAWTGENSTNTGRQINLNNGNGRFSDRYVEDGSFIRLKNAQLGYRFDAKSVSWLSSARLYVNAVNLLTFTDYSGYDPEVSAFGGAANRGVDLGSYPQSRTLIFGTNITF